MAQSHQLLNFRRDVLNLLNDPILCSYFASNVRISSFLLCLGISDPRPTTKPTTNKASSWEDPNGEFCEVDIQLFENFQMPIKVVDCECSPNSEIM